MSPKERRAAHRYFRLLELPVDIRAAFMMIIHLKASVAPKAFDHIMGGDRRAARSLGISTRKWRSIKDRTMQEWEAFK